MDNVKVFMREFYKTIMKGGALSKEYDWSIAYDRKYANYYTEIHTLTALTLNDDKDNCIFKIIYKMIIDENEKYLYSTMFQIGEKIISETDDKNEFEQIKNELNMFLGDFYDKILAYIHRYNMKQYSMDRVEVSEWPPEYKEWFTLSSIKNFIKENEVSPYVPIDLELVDEKGIPKKYFSMVDMYYYEGSNRVVISMMDI